MGWPPGKMDIRMRQLARKHSCMATGIRQSASVEFKGDRDSLAPCKVGATQGSRNTRPTISSSASPRLLLPAQTRMDGAPSARAVSRISPKPEDWSVLIHGRNRRWKHEAPHLVSFFQPLGPNPNPPAAHGRSPTTRWLRAPHATPTPPPRAECILEGSRNRPRAQEILRMLWNSWRRPLQEQYPIPAGQPE
jgi:hypothetical protein